MADKFGLKKALYGCAACFALSSLGVWAAGSFQQYIAFRILGGVGIGSASIVAPMYIAEISPAIAWNTQTGWRWMFAVAGIPALLFALAIGLSHESPRWLMKVNRVGEANLILSLINGPTVGTAEGEAIRRFLAEEKGS
ncbi:MAG: MFS transporter [Acidobacteriaceae bacterium]|nr:MFS transporter [Acidobacteriaceae bacterium]